jgi:dTDP-4-dehydrorhamnose reductase
MRVLVLGKSGQLGQALEQTAWPAEANLISLDRQAADLSEPAALAPVIRKHAPDAVIIAAAYTAVDAAEADETLATTVNARAPEIIAREAALIKAPVIYFSTDYVFDGEKAAPYEEEDAVGPLNVYGRSKLAGERAVRAANPQHLILRSSWIYSAGGTNFLRTMLRLATGSEEVRVVDDQVGCPTAAGDLAAATARLLPAIRNEDFPWGTYHVAGGSATSWHGFAEAIFVELSARGRRRPRNRAIATSEYPTPALRPKNSRLSCEKLAETLDIRLPGFEVVLPSIVDAALEVSPKF